MNDDREKKLSNLAWIGILLVAALVGFFIQPIIYPGDGDNDKQTDDQDILGYWKSYRVGQYGKKPGLIKVALDEEGTLMQSVIYESGPQCRIWIEDRDISYKNGNLRFWGDEFKGKMSPNKNSVMLVYKNRFSDAIPFVWERIQDQKSKEFLDRIEASRGDRYNYQIPTKTGDGWTCESMAEVGIDPGKIIPLIQGIKKGDYEDIHSLLLVKEGKLVLEEYFGARGKIAGPFINEVFRDRVQNLASVSKSVNSALVGIALKNGFIKKIDAPVSDYFPQYRDLLTGKKGKINLKHLLSMSAGFAWNELLTSYSNNQNDAMAMHRSDDIIRYCLEKKIIQEPGKWFLYNSALSIILGEVINRSSKMPVDGFAGKYLFKPLGINHYHWSKTKKGYIDTAGGLSLRARDMAKIGQLYLNQGQWEGKQILTKEWIETSISPQVKRLSNGFGYQWWLRSFLVNNKPEPCYYAHGNGGQFIFVFPGGNLIIVSTAMNFQKGWVKQFYKIIESHILPALE